MVTSCQNTVKIQSTQLIGQQLENNSFVMATITTADRWEESHSEREREREKEIEGTLGVRVREGVREKVVGLGGLSSSFPLAPRAATQWINSSTN